MQQNVSTAPAGNYNQYSNNNQYAANNNNQYSNNPYAAGGNTGNQYGQYGQQEQYAMGGGAAAPGPGAGGDFWSQLTETNQNLSSLQEQIQAVRQAHQQSLVSTLVLVPMGADL